MCKATIKRPEMEEVKLFQAVFQKGSQPNSKLIKL